MKISHAMLTMAAVAFCAWPGASLAIAKTPLETLPAPDKEALRVCTLTQLPGIHGASTEVSSAATADATWFMVERVRDEPAANFAAALSSSWSLFASDDAPELIARSHTLKPLCAKRWPASQRDYPVTLPTDDFDRAGICAGNASVLHGMAKTFEDSKLLAVTERVINWNSTITTDEAMTQHGFGGSDAGTKAIAAWLLAGHSLGNPITILAACNDLVPQ